MSKSQVKQRGLSLMLAGLVVLSIVAGSGVIGSVMGQSSTYEKTFSDTDNVRYVGFDTAGWSADTFQVEVSTTDGPGGENLTLYRENLTVAEIEGGSSVHVFENAGAYDSLTLTISNSANKPTFGIGSDFGELQFRQSDQMASTGGDRDLIADPMERIAMATNPAVNIVDVSGVPQATAVDESSLSSLDKNDTRLELYQAAAASSDSADNVHAIMNNQLQDAETVALVKGKNSYIRSLNNAGSKSAANASATENITEYYSRQEMNVISQWNQQISQAQYLHNLGENQSKISEDYVSLGFVQPTANDRVVRNHHVESFGSTTYTLQNGTTVTVQTVTLWLESEATANNNFFTDTVTFAPTDGTQYYEVGSTGGIVSEDQYFDRVANLTGITVYGSRLKNYGDKEFVEFSDYQQSLNLIDAQTTSSINQMGTVVDNTYSQYQTGEINSSQLVDPYVLQNSYSPGNGFQGWAAAQMASLGVNQPENYSTVGQMNVTVNGGTSYSGILHAASNPASGEFEVNSTYDPSNVGPVFITTQQGEIREISKNFTLDAVETQDGIEKKNITYVEKDYTTTNSEDLANLTSQIGELRAEIDAREQALAGGGGFSLDGIDNQTLVIVAVVGAAVLLARRD